MISKASTIADHTVMARMSTSWSIEAGRSALASRRRCCPSLMATARAPMLVRICRARRIRHHSGGGGIQHQRRGIGGRQAVIEPVHPEVGDRRHVDQEPGDHRPGNRQQQSLPDSPSRRSAWAAAAARSPDRQLEPQDKALFGLGVGRCGPAPKPVKLRIANVGGSPNAPKAPLTVKNPAKTVIFAPIATFRRSLFATPCDIDENWALPYKPRQLSAMARFLTGGSSLGP